jgi:uncharacterized membrane protein
MSNNDITKPKPDGNVVFQQQRIVVGPLPSPEIVAEYNQLIKGGAERIMVMAEQNQHHRISMENAQAKLATSYSLRSQIFAFIIALACLGAGLYAMMSNMEYAACVIFGTTIISVVTALLFQKKNKE